jgi:hypothetical protein
VRHTNITMSACSISGFPSTSQSAAAASMFMSRLGDASRLVIVGQGLQILVTSVAGALVMQHSIADSGSAITITNVSSVAPSTSVSIALLQNLTMESATLTIDTAAISGARSATLALDVSSTSLSNTVLRASHVVLSASNVVVVMLCRYQYLSSIPAPASITNTSVDVTDCQVAAVLPVSLYISSTSLTSVQILLRNVIMPPTSQYLGLAVSNSPGTV